MVKGNAAEKKVGTYPCFEFGQFSVWHCITILSFLEFDKEHLKWTELLKHWIRCGNPEIWHVMHILTHLSEANELKKTQL